MANLTLVGKKVQHTQNGRYVLNGTFADYTHKSVWIIKICDESDNLIVSARICADQPEALEVAESWLMRMLHTNPGKLLKYIITEHIVRN